MFDNRGYARWLFGFAAGCAALAACGGEGGSPEPTATILPTPLLEAPMCAPNFGGGNVTGAVAAPELVEISGLAASRSNEAVLWAHNDSGDSARVFALGAGGDDLGSYELDGVEALDWEDMALGPGPVEGVDYLYLADIGDNQAARESISVHRVVEPEVTLNLNAGEQTLTDVATLTLRYPDRPHDAETLLVDPLSGELVIVTKELGGSTSVFRTNGTWDDGASVTLELVAEIDFTSLKSTVVVPEDAPPLPRGAGHLPTGGDISPDGRIIAIRTYSTVWLWIRDLSSDVGSAFDGEPCEGPAIIERQGEAIAFTASGDGYITASESASPPIYSFLPP